MSAKQPIQQSLFNNKEKEIEDFLNFIHTGIEEKNNVFFSIAKFYGSDIESKYFNNTDKAMIWINKDVNVDSYFTVNQFNCPRRKSDYVYSFQGFYFDLDLHDNLSLDYNKLILIINELISYISFSVKKKEMLLPNLLVSSGRGIHLYYILDKSLPRKKLDWLYTVISEKLAVSLKEVINRINEDLQISITLDNCYRDISRLLRLPYTLNSKANVFSEIIYMSERLKYNIETLREFSEVPPKSDKPKKNKINKPKKLIFINKNLRLHNDRLSDLIKLLELRDYDIKGNRENILFLIRYYNNFIDINSSENLVQSINDNLKEPLKEKELLYTRSANKAYYNWLLDNLKGYNYKNDTLIKLLEITEEEQKELKTIISYSEKKRRAKEHNWYNDRRDIERANKNIELENSIRDMLRSGFTIRQIKHELKISQDRVMKVKRTFIIESAETGV